MVRPIRQRFRFVKYDRITDKLTFFWKWCKCEKCYDRGMYHNEVGYVSCECTKEKRNKERR